jgi:predicted amidophosphoribosyltransferase
MMDFESDVYDEDAAPCPSCEKHAVQSAASCIHCGYQFTHNDQESRDLYIRQSRRKGWVLAIIIFPVLLAALVGLFLFLDKYR